MPAVNHVFCLAGINLSKSTVISMLFQSFEKSCLTRMIRPLVLDVTLDLEASLFCLMSLQSYSQILNINDAFPFGPGLSQKG